MDDCQRVVLRFYSALDQVDPNRSMAAGMRPGTFKRDSQP
jgi:hypothetical protein